MAQPPESPNSGGSHTSRLKKFRGTKIDKTHREFELTYDMMLGIRTTVGQVESKPPRELTPGDFTEKIKLRFPAGGSHTTPAHDMRDFKFKDYCPEVFRKIRKRFGVVPAEYLLCVCGNFQFLEFISNSKSGQFFFHSHNQQYMIKTVSKEESKFLIKILASYYEHILNNPNTLITRFFGLHRVMPHKRSTVHFLIMGSVFYTQRVMHFTFDLKGSSHGRSASAKDKLRPTCVYKDNDILEMEKKICVGPERAAALLEQLEKDANYLRERKIMDYSLLLGMHDTNRPDKYKRVCSVLVSDEEKDVSTLGHRSQKSMSNKNIGTPMKYVDTEDDRFDPDGTPTMETPERVAQFGVPKNYDRLSVPAQSLFKAPEFPKSHEHKLEQSDARRQRHSIDFDTSLPLPVDIDCDEVGDAEGGFMGLNEDGTPNSFVYYLGIIDILIKFDSKKKVESRVKSLRHSKNTISAVSPKRYAKRFTAFMANIIK